MAPLTLTLVGILAVLALLVTGWVFWPAFHGAEAARKALGTHRLAFGSIVAVVVLNAIITLPLAPFLHVDQGLTAGTFLVAALSTEIPMLVIVYVRLILPGAVTWEELGLRRLRLDYAIGLGLAAGGDRPGRDRRRRHAAVSGRAATKPAR